MKKRSRQSHTGSVYKSGEWWYASIMVNGRRRRLKSKSKADAKRKLGELANRAQAVSSIARITIAGLREEWLSHIAKTKSRRTADTYTANVAVFDAVANIPVDKVRPSAV